MYNIIVIILLRIFKQNGVPIPLGTGRFNVEITPDEVIITDTKAEKEDAGQYKIDLENEKGRDSVPVTVKVVGPPEAPKGPLEISKIKDDSCTLAWNPPTVNLLLAISIIHHRL